MSGFLVLESGLCFAGEWRGGAERAGEVVFNTSHSGYEEMATDPSYFSQILITTASMQGNYGKDKKIWESRQPWINGFICLEIQKSKRDSAWLERLIENDIPVLTDIDTRSIVLKLRSGGVEWGAIVQANDEEEARNKAKSLIESEKDKPLDWCHAVSRKSVEYVKGENSSGPRVAVMDFGCKENILRELISRCSEMAVFPCRSSAQEIREWNPDGIMLSNGPGDPAHVEKSVDTVRELMGEKPIFGICMGHHILALALGAKTYKLKFGHRGSNHPVLDVVRDEICMTSQNHGYAVNADSVASDVQVTHINLNDKTVSGIRCEEKKCMSVQFHPESHPGPRDASFLFDQFVSQL